MIYMDHGATSLKKPKSVIDAVCQAMTIMGNPGRGSCEAALHGARIVYGAREALSDFFHVGDPSHVIFTSNATEALNTVITGMLEAGDHVVTTAMEHNSVLRPLYRMEEQGVELTILPLDERGNISLAELERSIRENTKAVICTHVSNVTGNVNDLEQIGAICWKHHVRLVVDASQSAGSFPIDMERMKIDVLCFTGHKAMLGPQGTGGICIRGQVDIRPLKVGGSGIHSFDHRHPGALPEALEAGTLNGHGIAGLLAAVEYIRELSQEYIRKKEEELTAQLYQGLKDIPGITIYGDFRDVHRGPIVSFTYKDYDSAQVADELMVTYGIASRAGAHCAPLVHHHFGTVDQGMVRLSLSHETTEEEIRVVVKAVGAL